MTQLIERILGCSRDQARDKLASLALRHFLADAEDCKQGATNE